MTKEQRGICKDVFLFSAAASVVESIFAMQGGPLGEPSTLAEFLDFLSIASLCISLVGISLLLWRKE